MAKYLTMPPRHSMICYAAAGLMYVMHPLAIAQPLPDPTRPPAGSVTAGEETASAARPILQSVLISPKRMEAIVSGKTVRVGDRVGEARVVRIAENEIILRIGKDLEVLKLFPDIEKRSGLSRIDARADNRRQ